jgi:hypothetical protein
LGYTINGSIYQGIEASTTYFVPLAEAFQTAS